MKILMSAYACEPGRGSEPGAGWAWARAAAAHHDVWVLTHVTNAASIDAALAGDHRLAERLHPVYLQNSHWARPLRRRGPTRFLYYLLWQLLPCRRESRRLHQVIGFDVCHHVTYAADWMPAGISAAGGVPLVWGPVGGSATTGARLWTKLGARVVVVEALRAIVLGAARYFIGRPLSRQAAAVLGQNADVAAAFAPVPVMVRPNVALDVDGAPRNGAAHPATGRTAVYAGRLLAWKGLRLALAALRRPEASGWRLEVYGDGPQRQRLEQLASRWNLDSRVHFHGLRPRGEVLDALTSADVFVFPSLHDSAGWSVAEAMALGCPVLCLDTGGPPTLVGAEDGVVVPLTGDVVGGLAAGLEAARHLRPRQQRWSARRLPDLLDGLYSGLVPAGHRVEVG